MNEHAARSKTRSTWLIRMALMAFVLGIAGPGRGAAQEAAKALEPARTAAAPLTGLQALQVRPDFIVISGAGGNVLVWSGADGIVVVDTGLAASATALFETIARVAPGRIRFVINTHGHPDHVGGNELALNRGATIIAHESVGQMARPTITMRDVLALHLNGDRLDIVHTADAHTRGDLVLRWAQAEVVDLGDLYWNGQYPYIDVAAGGSLAGLVAAIEASLGRSTERTLFVPGHGPASGRADLIAYRDMLVIVGRKVREASEQGKTLDEILDSHPTAQFDGRFGQGQVTPEDFVRTVHRDLTERRPGR